MIDDLDLMREWRDTDPITTEQISQLEDLGVTREAIQRAGGLGSALVRDIGGRIYTTDSDGVQAVVQAVWAGSAPSIFQVVECPVIFDLICWTPEDPTLWLYRLGDAGGVLGAENLEFAHAEGLPISFATTPRDWLIGDCRGACLLDYCEGYWTLEREAA